MSTPMQDAHRVFDAARAADEWVAARPDADGRDVGVHGDAIKAAALQRTRLVLEHLSQLPKVLTDKQLKEVEREMITMWMDGFTIGRIFTQAEES